MFGGLREGPLYVRITRPLSDSKPYVELLVTFNVSIFSALLLKEFRGVVLSDTKRFVYAADKASLLFLRTLTDDHHQNDEDLRTDKESAFL